MQLLLKENETVKVCECIVIVSSKF